ncbi:MAG: hypothetical protein F4W93_02030 [Dehalococcoidia bacterium]|nr:hypothetical protein [Dehalococcoidia bacterium]
MKRRSAILFGAIVFLVIVVGCSAGVKDARQSEPPSCNAECKAEIQANLEYLTENFPTREQTIRVRECVTARTGYEYEDELPADYGPELLTKPGGTSESPTPEPALPSRLVERVLVAVGQRTPIEARKSRAFEECVWELGLEDRYYPPWDQKHFRPRSS